MEKKTRAEREGYHLMIHATKKEVREGINEYKTLEDRQDYIVGVKVGEEELIAEGKLTDVKRPSKYLEVKLSEQLKKAARRRYLQKRAGQGLP